MDVYVSKDGQQYGPYTVEQLREYVQEGNFTTADLACCDGQNWVKVAELPGFDLKEQPSPIQASSKYSEDSLGEETNLPSNKLKDEQDVAENDVDDRNEKDSPVPSQDQLGSEGNEAESRNGDVDSPKKAENTPSKASFIATLLADKQKLKKWLIIGGSTSAGLTIFILWWKVIFTIFLWLVIVPSALLVLACGYSAVREKEKDSRKMLLGFCGGALLLVLVAWSLLPDSLPDLDDAETLKMFVAEAIDYKKLQERGQKGEELNYAPNEQTPYTGWAKQMYDSGQIHELRQYKDGKQDGSWTNWYMNGQKSFEINYQLGKKDGLEIRWYADGQKESEANYKNGKVHGLWTSWNENGQKWVEVNLNMGQKEGLRIFWHKNGQKRLEESFHDDKKHGSEISWYENGQRRSENSYQNGKLMVASLWKPNGDKCLDTNVRNGDGHLVEWNSNGNGHKVEEGKYKNGEKNGIWIFYKYPLANQKPPRTPISAR